MPRTLSGTIEAAIAEDLTTPVYLVEADLDTPVYWTTSFQVVWNGQNWLPVGVRVGRLNDDTTTLQIPNLDNIGVGLILVDGVRDRLFKIYEYHDGDAVEVYRGYGGESTLDIESASLTLHRTRRDRTHAPRTRVAPPLFTRLPRPGAKITWGDTIITVESE
ncbi:hypothetical protein F3N42_03630 [Marinihelvus fidelis]|uniref:Uncharacterized protein n=1 Tax=Marinihelvus fidelis TaxID=2613842 RepID=A0A5N0TEC8_9GAMM|nr:hypothetical protein [Marinihelvus fidelis]KAA9133453.1 hypothetical protein F3N42_03630 [Marinihelvus fidelis]